MRLFALATVALLLTGCAPAPELERGIVGTVTVFAAASLTDAFTDIAAAFTEENPDVEIVFSFGGSSTLATQIVEGAPADVFAAASPATMSTVVDAGLATADPVAFATNVLEIAVPTGNPGGVTGLSDFANSDLLIAVCAVEVPCGSAADKAFTAAGITPSIDTYEQDVKAVLSKVELGEVDAGLVYVTDVLANGKVDGIELSDVSPVEYPIVSVSDNEAARAFIAFVLGGKGQAILTAAGFGAA
jgi:molybdate transport system substrate-binding protein